MKPNHEALKELYKEKGELITTIQLYKIRLQKVDEEISKLLGVAKVNDKDSSEKHLD